MKRLLPVPGAAFRNRALMAVGRAFCTGDTSELDDLKRKIQSGEVKSLSRAEQDTWRAYAMQKQPFRRGRGEWRDYGGLDKREEHAERTAALAAWLRQIRAALKADPDEQAEMREHRKSGGYYRIEDRTIELAIDYLQKNGDADSIIPSEDTLRYLLRGRGKKLKAKTTS